jgi:hypothetical protein
MKISLTTVALLALSGFAFGATGCVTEYQTVSTVPVHSATTLPAASRVALVLEFRGGTPSPDERADVIALLADYLAGKGSVLVENPADADYYECTRCPRAPATRQPGRVTDVETYFRHTQPELVFKETNIACGRIVETRTTNDQNSKTAFGVIYPDLSTPGTNPWHQGGHQDLPPPSGMIVSTSALA